MQSARTIGGGGLRAPIRDEPSMIISRVRGIARAAKRSSAAGNARDPSRGIGILRSGDGWR
jgi:hypothetical protein